MNGLASGVGLAVLMAAGAFAADNETRAKLAGSWQSSEAGEWVLTDKGNAFQITHTQNNQKLATFDCNTNGRECEMKDSGKPVKISMWFNGAKLVVMETRGDDIVKHRFHAVGDNEMEVELVPIAPTGKTEVQRLHRAATAQ